jgi:hypothetical protein
MSEAPKDVKAKVRYYSGLWAIVFGVIFALTSAQLILALVLGGNLHDFFDSESGHSFFLFKASFWVVVVCLIVLVAAGGQVSRLWPMKKFPYEEE